MAMLQRQLEQVGQELWVSLTWHHNSANSVGAEGFPHFPALAYFKEHISFPQSQVPQCIYVHVYIYIYICTYVSCRYVCNSMHMHTYMCICICHMHMYWFSLGRV